MRFAPLFLAVACVLSVGVICADQAGAELVGLWEFEDGGNLAAATIGGDLALSGSEAAVAGTGGSDSGATSLDNGDFYTVTNPIGASGGGSRTNQYTLLMDIKIVGGVTGFSSLAEFDGDPGDGDLFLDDDGPVSRIGVGSEGYVSTSEAMGDSWHRLVLSVDNSVVRSMYLDGSLVGDHNPGSIDGRWSIGNTFDAFSDVGGGEEVLTHLSNMALFDTALDASAVANLGGAGVQVVPEPSTVVLSLFGALGIAAMLRTRRRRS